MAKKLAGVLPKNVTEPIPYKEPERPKRFEVEQAHDGSFIISCYGGKGGDSYMGKKHTSKNSKEVMEKFEAFMSSKGEKAEKKEE